MSRKIKSVTKVVVVIIICLIMYLILFSGNTVQKKTWMGHELNKDQLLLSKDSFNMVNASGEKIGSMVIEGKWIGANYVWKDLSILDGVVSERTTYMFDQSLQLIETTIDFAQGQTTLLGELKWDKGQVTGKYEVLQGENSRKIAVDTTFTNLRDRAEVFAFVQALPLSIGLKFPVNVLVQPGMEIWEMNLEVVGDEKCLVPSGEFDTFKINLTGGKLSNVLYVSKGDQRKLVKVDVVGQPMTIELVSSGK
ncbi:MAG: hypothetical protein RLO12_08060 [Fulvivirga sp.]